MPGKHGIHNLRDDSVFVAVNSRKERLARFETREKIVAQLLLHGAMADFFFRPCTAAKFTKITGTNTHRDLIQTGKGRGPVVARVYVLIINDAAACRKLPSSAGVA